VKAHGADLVLPALGTALGAEARVVHDRLRADPMRQPAG
jgi:hypothetical protein